MVGQRVVGVGVVAAANMAAKSRLIQMAMNHEELLLSQFFLR